MSEALSEEIRRVVLTSIPSVPFLEALLLLHRQAPQRLPAGEVARRLYLGEAVARELLDAIVAAGFAASENGLYSLAGDDERLALVARLAHCWSKHLVEMTTLIHDNTQRKSVRFADAFRLRKEP